MTDNPYPAPLVAVTIGKVSVPVTVSAVWRDRDSERRGRGRTSYAFRVGPTAYDLDDLTDDDARPVTLSGVSYAGWAHVHVYDDDADALRPMVDGSVKRWPGGWSAPDPTPAASRAFHAAWCELARRLHTAPAPDKVNGNGSPDYVVKLAAELRSRAGGRDARQRTIDDARDALHAATREHREAERRITELVEELGGPWADVEREGVAR